MLLTAAHGSSRPLEGAQEKPGKQPISTRTTFLLQCLSSALCWQHVTLCHVGKENNDKPLTLFKKQCLGENAGDRMCVVYNLF